MNGHSLPEPLQGTKNWGIEDLGAHTAGPESTEERAPSEEVIPWPLLAAQVSEELAKTLEPLVAKTSSGFKILWEKRQINNRMRWYYEKKELRSAPSVQAGLDQDRESRYRREGARFIIDVGSSMTLSLTTMATGVVYFHRFYMFHTFQDFPRYPTALACLFLAGKVEETPKKCRDMLKVAKEIVGEDKAGVFAGDIFQKCEEIMTLERIILQTIKFDLYVEHPYTFLLKYAKCLKGDKARLQKMVQMAWTFVNDSLCTTLCLQWEPEIVAIALMHLAGKLSKFEVQDWVGRTTDHLRWWDMFVEDMTIELLEDICHQVLDLYSQTQTQPQTDSPPPNALRGALPQPPSSTPLNPPMPPQPPPPSTAAPPLPGPAPVPSSKGGGPLPPLPGGVPPVSYSHVPGQPPAPFMYGMQSMMPPQYGYHPPTSAGAPPIPTTYPPPMPPHSHQYYPPPPLPPQQQPPPPPK